MEDMNEMEKVRLLNEINDTLKYQTKLFESMFHMVDGNRNRMSEQMKAMEKMKDMVMNNPILKKHPEVMEIINQAFAMGGQK